MGAAQRPALIGVGEVLWDCFGESRRPGGAPANVAFHAGQLGLQGVVCSRVGRDELGDELVRYLGDAGLDTGFIQRDEHHPTSTVTVNTQQDDQPTFVIRENVAWDYLEFDGAWARLFARAAAVCFGTLAQRSEVSRAAIARGLEAAEGALRVYDVNLRPPWFSREVIEASLRRSDLVKLNADEVATLAKLLPLDAEQTQDFAHALLDRYGVKVVCVTRGRAGCAVFTRDASAEVPGRPVPTVDAVGAGDAFTAALTRGLLQGWPLETTARFANEVGALVAGHRGAMPMLRDEFAVLETQFRPELKRGSSA